MKLRAVYDLPELARVAGFSSARQLAAILAEAKIPTIGGGRGKVRRVRLSDLRRMDPDLWDSIRLASGSEEA